MHGGTLDVAPPPQASPHSDALAEDLGKGATALARGDYDLALVCYRAALARDSGSVEALVGHGRALAGLGNHAAAVADFTQAIYRDGRCGAAYFHRGVSKVMLEEYDAGVADCKEAQRLGVKESADKALAQACGKNGGRYFTGSDWLASYLWFGRAARHDPDAPLWHTCLVMACKHLGYWDEAVAEAEKAVKAGASGPEDHGVFAEAYLGRANARLTAGDPAGARKDYEVASKYDPELRQQRARFNPPAQTSQGQVPAAGGFRGQASPGSFGGQTRDQGRRQPAETPDALLAQARSAYLAGDNVKAERRLLEAASACDADRKGIAQKGDAFFLLGVLYAKRSLTEQAYQQMTSAIRYWSEAGLSVATQGKRRKELLEFFPARGQP
jgi:tetratricopeptide (TPR) repeat protein